MALPRASILAALIACAAPALAQGIVVRARGPSAAVHPIGSTLAPGAPLLVGDRIDVLERGGTRQLVGATRYVPAMKSSATENVRLVVAQLLDRRQIVRRAGAVDATARASETRSFPHRSRIGAVRASSDPGRYARTLWMIDTSEPGTTCFRRDQPPMLWRAPVAAPADVSIAALGGKAAPVRWPNATPIAPLPGPAPEQERRYTLTSGAATTEVTLVPIAAPATIDDPAVALDRAGCRAQLSYLLDRYLALP